MLSEQAITNYRILLPSLAIIDFRMEWETDFRVESVFNPK
jgi:hypothetical protein